MIWLTRLDLGLATFQVDRYKTMALLISVTATMHRYGLSIAQHHDAQDLDYDEDPTTPDWLVPRACGGEVRKAERLDLVAPPPDFPETRQKFTSADHSSRRRSIYRCTYRGFHKFFSEKE